MAIFTLICIILNTSLNLGDKLFLEGDYFNAITEYKRELFLGVEDSIRILHMIAFSYEKRNKPEFAVKYWSQLNYLTSGELVETHLAYNLIKMGRYREAYLVVRSDTTLRGRKLKAIALGLLGKYEDAICVLDSAGLSIPSLPPRNLVLLSSALIPGLGLVLTGEYERGLWSFLFTVVSAYFTKKLVDDKNYRDAIMVGNTFFLRFYTGNLKNTIKFYEKKKERFFKKLLKGMEKEFENDINAYIEQHSSP